MIEAGSLAPFNVGRQTIVLAFLQKPRALFLLGERRTELHGVFPANTDHWIIVCRGKAGVIPGFTMLPLFTVQYAFHRAGGLIAGFSDELREIANPRIPDSDQQAAHGNEFHPNSIG